MKLRRTLRFLPALAFMALIFFFSSLPEKAVARATDPVIKQQPKALQPLKIKWLKVGHFVGYAGLGAALLYGFRPRGRKTAEPLALGVSVVYAVTDEIHQTFVTGRSAAVSDVLLDSGAALAAILVIKLIRWLVETRKPVNR